MITNSGKDIIAKYLLGQTSSYATHIAIGCGTTPLNQIDPIPAGVDKKEILDFEMLRVPITSRGLVKENGTTQVALTAELPSENRYEITEVALWSAASNSLARNSDSRMIFTFQENWEAHSSSVSPITIIPSLGTGFNINDEGQDIFIANNGDKVLDAESRLARNEGPRFLNRSIFMRGDSSIIESEDISITSATSNGSLLTYSATNDFSEGDRVTVSSCSNTLFNIVNAPIVSATSSTFSIQKGVPSSQTSLGGTAWLSNSWSPEEDPEGFISKHIHLNGVSLNLGQNNARDELALAVSVLDKNFDGSDGTPEFVKIIVEFYRNELDQETGYARAELYLDSSELTNRYHVFRFPISDLIVSPDFAFSQVRVARVFSYVAVEEESELVPSSKHYVVVYGFRLDNVTTQNPLYKMVGYSPTRTPQGIPVTKFANTTNYVEFRFNLGVT
jgi:hypothetical protein